jgi:hypothetical protein
MVLSKSVAMGAVPIPPFGGPFAINVGINLFLTCPSTNNCGAPCPNPAVPVTAEIIVNLYGPYPSAASCPLTPPLPPPAYAATIDTGGGTMSLPLCTPAGANNAYNVGVTVPAGAPPGAYCVVGTANVAFSDGTVLTQSGDTVVCLVEPAPGQTDLPRLGLTLVSEAFPRMAPGDQATAIYRVTNHDRSNSVQLLAFGTSRQVAVRPQGANEARGVFAISSPFGDDFPILINPGTNCIPLPDHPFTQKAACAQGPRLAPGESTTLTVGVRSYGQCADGSCSETTLRVEGTFSDGKPAMACAGMSLVVDTSKPSQNWGRDVNDCNQNGIPDALDIASRRSADQNFNAMPDECENAFVVPIVASVVPTNPVVGAPLRVQVAFNENVDIPLVNVWADGTPLVRTQAFGFPFWVGTIAADTRPGPQTVFFLGKDSRGGLVSYAALYSTRAAKETPFDGFQNYPLGNAELDQAGGTLKVAGLGSSGDDGATIVLGGVGGFSANVQPLGLSNNAAAVHLSAVGVLDGRANAFLGQASLVHSEGAVQVTADYRAIGDANVLVEVWNRGVFVGGTTLPAGPLGRLVGPVVITRIGKFGVPIFPECIPVDFLLPVTFLAHDNKSFQGTQLRLLSATGRGQLQALSRFNVQAANVGGSLTLLDESRLDAFDLRIAKSSNDVVVSWNHAPNFVLETLDKLGGPHPWPWREVPNAHSPHVISQPRGQEYFRLRRDTVPAPPQVSVPPVIARAPLNPNSTALPQGATGQLPGFDGDPLFVSLPVTQRTTVSPEEVYNTLLLPILVAADFEQGANSYQIPERGMDQRRCDWNVLAQTVKYQYDNSPGIAGPKTTNMLNVFLGLAPPDAEIDAALLMGEGMTYNQYVAGIQRLEIQYPFQQMANNLPIEHTMIIASRWEGQGITSVFGSFLSRHNTANQLVITGTANIVQAAILALSRTPGLCPPITGPEDGPHLVMLPCGTDTAGVYQLRYAYRLRMSAWVANVQDVGPLLVWLDAENGEILKLDPLIHTVNASGRVYNRDPGIGTTTSSFQVDAAAGGQYVLKLSGVLNRVDYQDNGFNAQDVSISSTLNGSSATFANFNQAPINDAAQALAGSGSNKAFQQVNFFASLYRYYQRSLADGVFTPFPTAAWNPRVEVPSYCNANASMKYGACQGYFDPACPSFTTGTINFDNMMNFAHDNSVVAHELAHNITPRFTQNRPANWCGMPACAIPLGWSLRFHDLADFWADMFESCNCTAGWVAKNQNGVNGALNCVGYTSEGGGLPRIHQVTWPFNPASPGDHFPEHRLMATGDYADMQIPSAALWQVLVGMRSKCRPSGAPQFEVRFARALKNTGFFGAEPGSSDLAIYRYLYDLEVKLVDQWATSGSPSGPPAFAHNGPHTTSKVTAGFAKAGLFLIPPDRLDGNPAPPDNGGDAVIDIDDNTPGDDVAINGCLHPEVDFLRLNGPAPTFHVWTGPRYRLNGAGGAATYNNPAPCNTQFQVEVSTSSTFPGPSTINSGFIAVDTNPTTAASPEGYGTWTPSAAQWTTLQAGGAGSRIYYRARTRDAANANERLSTLPGNGLWNVPPPYAVITADGKSDY